METLIISLPETLQGAIFVVALGICLFFILWGASKLFK
ncbi:hypothetical protein LCGC14_1062820 [marine sediment metagenome]|uniref:Uncharacterized protein n=1 Tax=marine sediment metagenome TaxID=412755 RepID=A0A0F9MQ80_9ZZZZ